MNPVYGAENFAHRGLSIAVQQQGTNTSSSIGLLVSMIKATGATTLDTMTGALFSTVAVTGIVSNTRGIEIEDQSATSVVTSYGISILNQVTAGSTATRAVRLAGTGANNGLQLGDTGVLISNDGDGAITFLGSSAGADEDLTLNLDDTTNAAVFSSSTGVLLADFGTIDIGTAAIDLVTGIDAVAGDSATINATAGRFRKDVTGTTFTLTNSYIATTSIILLTYASDPGATGFDIDVVAGAGSATITFETSGVPAAPTNNADINFLVIN